MGHHVCVQKHILDTPGPSYFTSADYTLPDTPKTHMLALQRRVKHHFFLHLKLTRHRTLGRMQTMRSGPQRLVSGATNLIHVAKATYATIRLRLANLNKRCFLTFSIVPKLD